MNCALVADICLLVHLVRHPSATWQYLQSLVHYLRMAYVQCTLSIISTFVSMRTHTVHKRYTSQIACTVHGLTYSSICRLSILFWGTSLCILTKSVRTVGESPFYFSVDLLVVRVCWRDLTTSAVIEYDLTLVLWFAGW